jgi:hypothetical protein
LAFRAAAQRFFCAAGHAPAASTSTGWQLHVQRAGSLRCMRSYQQNPARCDLGPSGSEQGALGRGVGLRSGGGDHGTPGRKHTGSSLFHVGSRVKSSLPAMR